MVRCRRPYQPTLARTPLERRSPNTGMLAICVRQHERSAMLNFRAFATHDAQILFHPACLFCQSDLF